MTTPRITWTKVDEAPALASYAFLPVIKAFTAGSGIEIETADISLVGRIIANFPDNLITSFDLYSMVSAALSQKSNWTVKNSSRLKMGRGMGIFKIDS